MHDGERGDRFASVDTTEVSNVLARSSLAQTTGGGEFWGRNHHAVNEPHCRAPACSFSTRAQAISGTGPCQVAEAVVYAFRSRDPGGAAANGW